MTPESGKYGDEVCSILLEEFEMPEVHYVDISIYLSLCIHPINCCQVPNDLFPEGVQFGFYYNYCAEEDWHDSGARSTARVCCQVGAMAHRCG